MAGTPPSAKRMKTRDVRSGGNLEGWFSGESELIDKYLHETSRKIVNTPKFVSFTWMKQQNLSTVRSLLNEQGLKRFLELTGNIYPNLVKVFYTNLQFNGVPSRTRALTKSRSKSTPEVKVNTRRRIGEETLSASITKKRRRQGKASPR